MKISLSPKHWEVLVAALKEAHYKIQDRHITFVAEGKEIYAFVWLKGKEVKINLGG